MSIEMRKSGDVTILDIRGRITFSKGSGELSDTVSDLLEAGEMKILLNTEDVQHMDSQGIAELLKAHISATSSMKSSSRAVVRSGWPDQVHGSEPPTARSAHRDQTPYGL